MDPPASSAMTHERLGWEPTGPGIIEDLRNSSIHLATSPDLGTQLAAEGLGRPLPWIRGWTLASVHRLGVAGAAALFGRNYDRLRPGVD